MKMIRLCQGIFILSTMMIVGCFEDNKNKVAAMELTREHECAHDGMILVDYIGPKAQLVWKDGKRTFYCEAREAFNEWLDPIQNKRIAGFFVQDFSDISWGSYTDKWISADQAIFVIDSKKEGAMGLSYVPFSQQENAIKFHKENGGEILKTAAINQEVLMASNSKLKKRLGCKCKHRKKQA